MLRGYYYYCCCFCFFCHVYTGIYNSIPQKNFLDYIILQLFCGSSYGIGNAITHDKYFVLCSISFKRMCAVPNMDPLCSSSGSCLLVVIIIIIIIMVIVIMGIIKDEGEGNV